MAEVIVLLMAPFVGLGAYRVQTAIKHHRWKKLWAERMSSTL